MPHRAKVAFPNSDCVHWSMSNLVFVVYTACIKSLSPKIDKSVQLRLNFSLSYRHILRAAEFVSPFSSSLCGLSPFPIMNIMKVLFLLLLLLIQKSTILI